MQTTLLLVRHGQTSWNTLRKIQGSTNIPLEDTGRLQAQLLAEKLNGDFSALYTSPLERAYETATILAGPSNVSPIAIDGLREVNFGLWEGLTFTEVATQYPDAYALWRQDELEGPLCGGDGSIKACSLRSRNCILELVQKHQGETIVCVSHGGLIKSALIGLFDLKMTMYHQMAFGNTCVTTIRFDENLHPVLVNLNDTSHLMNQKAQCI